MDGGEGFLGQQGSGGSLSQPRCRVKAVAKSPVSHQTPWQVGKSGQAGPRNCCSPNRPGDLANDREQGQEGQG